MGVHKGDRSGDGPGVSSDEPRGEIASQSVQMVVAPGCCLMCSAGLLLARSDQLQIVIARAQPWTLDAVTDASALIVVTEWREFRSPDFVSIRDRMQTPVVFDGRNLYEPQSLVDLGFEYSGIGRRAQAPDSLAHELMTEETAA